MVRHFKIVVYATLFLLVSCNSLYQSVSLDLEIVEPAAVLFSPQYRQVAVRNNNSNVAFNPYFAEYIQGDKVIVDTINSDSIVAIRYFRSFLNNFKGFALFDTVFELPPADYSSTKFIADDAAGITESTVSIGILADLYNNFPAKSYSTDDTVFLDPVTGIYNRQQLQQIADTTGADLLISLDYFAMNEKAGIKPVPYFNVYLLAHWTFYDLESLVPKHYYHRVDTFTWSNELNQIVIPERKIAIREAAFISGRNYANFLVPHWIRVSRSIYVSPDKKMKKAFNLANENKWLEAAAVWKTLINDSNKRIAAKSMFNMALACEVNGNLDAAIDWTVRSYYIFKEKNELHAFNCKEYLRVLALRKKDMEQLEMQVIR